MQVIRKSETTAANRQVPVFFRKTDQQPYVDGSNDTQTDDVTVTWIKSDGTQVDVTGTLVAGKGGRAHVVLTQANVDTEGMSWITWTGPDVPLIDDSEAVQVRDLDAERLAAVTATLAAISASLARVLGISQENAVIDNQTWTVAGKLATWRLRVFANAAAAAAAVAGAGNGTDGEAQRYTGSCQYDGNDRPEDFRLVRAL